MKKYKEYTIKTEIILNLILDEKEAIQLFSLVYKDMCNYHNKKITDKKHIINYIRKITNITPRTRELNLLIESDLIDSNKDANEYLNELTKINVEKVNKLIRESNLKNLDSAGSVK